MAEGGLGAALRRCRAVALDVDGTLTDSVGQIVACTMGAFARLGLPEPSRAAALSIIGMRLEDGMATLAGGDGAALALAYRSLQRERPWLGRHAFFPGIFGTLHALRARGYRLGLCTGRSLPGLKEMLATTMLGRLVDAAVAGTEAPSKPSPVMMGMLAGRLGVPAGEILGVGDATLDMGMFRAAGCPALGVLSGTAGEGELRGAGADFVLPRLDALQRYLPRPAP
ncbi:MAG: HAD hydrolase-like protein [Succinivibrionaceae bacterium]|nr:HAD hydrolase-like protein [Succinivibrionaceae bacterium]